MPEIEGYFEPGRIIHPGAGRSREAFARFRIRRDAQLPMPRLIIPSLQVNMRAGDFLRDDSGAPMLKVPVNVL